MLEIKDTAIIGAGPAGMSAAIYITRFGYSVSLFEQLAAGGQAALTYMVENYPGFDQGIQGMDLTDNMRKQAEHFGAEFIYDEVKSFSWDEQKKIYTLITGLGKEYYARTVLIATGSASRKLGALGEEKFFGRGIGTCAVCDGAFYKNKQVAVIGGGNSALEESIYLSRIASKVYLIHRREEFRADNILQKRVRETPNIELILNTVVHEFAGNQHLEKIVLQNVATQNISELPIDGVFLYVGLQPNTEFLDQQFKDAQGFIVTDKNFVNKQGLFAAGDCCVGSIKQIVNACADGVSAAYQISDYLTYL
ncbi:MAG: thioredoxin-disulfide reductase [Brevinemataceae bacterium]